MTGKTILAGVIGNPISHSKSPIMHNYWLKKYNINGQYLPIEVKEEHFRDVLRNLYKMGFRGVNVTIPYKMEAYKAVDNLTDNAIKCGSVNTVIIDDDGNLYGDNTDGYGFIQNVLDHYPEFDFSNGKTVILGAGGAARAVTSSIVDKGCKELVIVARTIENAMEIVQTIKGNIIVVGWDDREKVLEGDTNLLVNCTPLGMVNKPELEIDISLLSPNALVIDVVYNPLETEFLKKAKLHGNKTLDGIGMLINQARPAFETWFETTPEITDELKEMLLK